LKDYFKLPNKIKEIFILNEKVLVEKMIFHGQTTVLQIKYSGNTFALSDLNLWLHLKLLLDNHLLFKHFKKGFQDFSLLCDFF